VKFIIPRPISLISYGLQILFKLKTRELWTDMHVAVIPKDTPLHSCNDRHTYWQPLSACPVEEKTPHCFPRGREPKRQLWNITRASSYIAVTVTQPETILDALIRVES
jgi:hypothetical protein